MRNRILALAAALSLLTAGPAWAQDDASIHAALDAQYKKLAEAHDRKDRAAIARLKTADFHAIFPDGKVGDVKAMAEYTNQFLEKNKPPYNVHVTIQTLTVSENRLIAVAEVLQEASRMRDMMGTMRRVDTSVRQRETWSKTPDGWKLKCVDNVRDQRRYVDGKRVDPTKPYDPDAAPFAPDSTTTKP